MRLCTEDCDRPMKHDDVIELLRRVETERPELLDVLYQDELLVGCDVPQDPAVSRLQTLRTLMRAFGYLEPPPPAPKPPCNQIA